MTIELQPPGSDTFAASLDAVTRWQSDDVPFQLHPGDVGWFERLGIERAIAFLRSWRDGNQIVAVGLLDGPDLLRLTVAPEHAQNEELAARIATDLATPALGVFPEGAAAVETPMGIVLRELLLADGWNTGDPWTPLRRDLSGPVGGIDLRIEEVTVALIESRVAVQRASFENSVFTAAAWRSMAAGHQFDHARDLLGFDPDGTAVAAITVWSAGPGRPGLIEPMGVHRDHYGHGYGTAITLAGAAALREAGSSSAVVCTYSSNIAGIATYRKAGFEPLPERLDLSRTGQAPA